jgi:hypothetical protein
MKSSYSLTDIVVCPSCGCRFSIADKGPIFRSCDAYVCSHKCSYLRAKLIASIDRNLNNPMSWPMQRSHSSTNINKPQKSTTWSNPEEIPIMMGLEEYNSNPKSSIQIDRQIYPINNQQNIERVQNIALPITCIVMITMSILAIL